MDIKKKYSKYITLLIVNCDIIITVGVNFVMTTTNCIKYEHFKNNFFHLFLLTLYVYNSYQIYIFSNIFK